MRRLIALREELDYLEKVNKNTTAMRSLPNNRVERIFCPKRSNNPLTHVVPRALRARNAALTSFSALVLRRAARAYGRRSLTNIPSGCPRLRLLPSRRKLVSAALGVCYVTNESRKDIIMTMKFSSFAVAAFGLLAVADPTLAQIITNGSFETGTRGRIAQGNLRASAGFGVSDGTNALLFNSGDTTPNGVLSQAFPTTPGKRYLLRYDYGALSFYPSSRQSLAVSVSGATLLLSETNSVTTFSPNLSFSTYAYFFSADSLTTLMFRDISRTLCQRTASWTTCDSQMRECSWRSLRFQRCSFSPLIARIESSTPRTLAEQSFGRH